MTENLPFRHGILLKKTFWLGAIQPSKIDRPKIPRYESGEYKTFLLNITSNNVNMLFETGHFENSRFETLESSLF